MSVLEECLYERDEYINEVSVLERWSVCIRKYCRNVYREMHILEKVLGIREFFSVAEIWYILFLCSTEKNSS